MVSIAWWSVRSKSLILNLLLAVVIKDTKEKLAEEISKKNQLNDSVNSLEAIIQNLESNLKSVKEEIPPRITTQFPNFQDSRFPIPIPKPSTLVNYYSVYINRFSIDHYFS